jgi:GNAT superfamily N-acetyltransferase
MARKPRPPAPPLAFHPATPERWPDVERLFGRNGACGGCWCRFWKQDNAAYRAGKGERNKAALRRSVRGGEVPGLLAYAPGPGGEPVAWVAVEPRAAYGRLAISRNLLPVDGQEVWSAPCFFVARGWRGKGVAGALLAAAADHARGAGGRILEGYPIDADRPMAGPWLYPGAFSTFLRLGFAEVARRARTRPVVRLALRRGVKVVVPEAAPAAPAGASRRARGPRRQRSPVKRTVTRRLPSNPGSGASSAAAAVPAKR